MTSAGTPLLVYLLLLPALGVAAYLTLHHGLLWLSDRSDEPAGWTALWALASFFFTGARLYQKTHLDPATTLICIRILLLSLCLLLYSLVTMVRLIAGQARVGVLMWALRLMLLGLIVSGLAASYLFPTSLQIRTDRTGVPYYAISNRAFLAMIASSVFLAAVIVWRAMRRSVTLKQPEQRAERLLFAGALWAMLLLAVNDILQLWDLYRFFLLAELMPMPMAIALSVIAARRQHQARVRLEARVEERTIELSDSNQQLQVALHDAVQSEGNLRTLFDASPDALLVARGPVVLIGNDAANQIFGDLAARPLTELILDLDLHSLPLDHPQAHVFRRADGSEGHAEVLCRELTLEGQVSHLWILRDVTDRKALEQQLQRAERMAALGALAATVAHEVNNPLSYVIGNLSLLKMELAGLPLSDAQRQELSVLTEDAIEGSHRVRDIVRDLRQIGRSNGDAIVPIDLRVLLGKVEKLTRSDVRTRGRLQHEVTGDGFVLGNEMRLVQILVNLILNAAQALAPGNPERNWIKIQVCDANEGADTDRVEILISDSGSGIAPEQLPRIFEPFFSTKRGSGTGIGLSITRDLVRQLGGSITVESQLGVGTTFRLLLPRAQAIPEPAADDATDRVLQRRWRILVVDDEPLIGRAIERMLDKHEVKVVKSCQTGIEEVIASPTWDAILCDVLLGIQSGGKLLQYAREHQPHLVRRFLFMTGGTPADLAALGLPPDSIVLWKPFDERRLREALVMLEDLREEKA